MHGVSCLFAVTERVNCTSAVISLQSKPFNSLQIYRSILGFQNAGLSHGKTDNLRTIGY